MKEYFKFIKWYFNFIGDSFFDNKPGHNITSHKLLRRERFPYTIISYLLALSALVSFLIFSYCEFYLAYFLSIAMIIGAICGLNSIRFSFVHYFFTYLQFSRRDNSVNDSIICDHCILFKYPTDIVKIISKYCHLYEVKGNIFGVKFYLGPKTKKSRKQTKFKNVILKITPNKVYFGGKLIFKNKILRMRELEDFIREGTNLNY